MPTQSPAPAMSATYDTGNHQLGLLYDASGNQLADPLQTVVYGWDGENRMVSQATLMFPSSTTAYTYDAWGKRVEVHSKPAGADETWEFDFYGVTGQKLAALTCDTDASAGTTSCGLGGIGYFGGKRLGVVTDRLGSVRWSYGTSISYFPYGEERTVTADGTEKFGTYFRDGVGQDYAEQRYYNNGTGRFWSVDPGGIGSADPSTPTSLNRYAYTNGDPVNFFDRRGLIAQAPSAEDCIANPEYCEAWDWNSAYGCNPGMYLVAQPGCETGGGGDSGEDPTPDCLSGYAGFMVNFVVAHYADAVALSGKSGVAQDWVLSWSAYRAAMVRVRLPRRAATTLAGMAKETSIAPLNEQDNGVLQ